MVSLKIKVRTKTKLEVVVGLKFGQADLMLWTKQNDMAKKECGGGCETSKNSHVWAVDGVEGNAW